MQLWGSLHLLFNGTKKGVSLYKSFYNICYEFVSLDILVMVHPTFFVSSNVRLQSSQKQEK